MRTGGREGGGEGGGSEGGDREGGGDCGGEGGTCWITTWSVAIGSVVVRRFLARWLVSKGREASAMARCRAGRRWAED